MADRAGKTYVVSGGASGLGEATCRALIAQGANVGVLDRDEDKGKQLAAELGPRAAFFFMDATKEETIKKAVDACKDKFGGIHGAVACAGVGAATTTLGKGGKPHDSGVWDFVIKVNLYGVFNLAKYAASHVSVSQRGLVGCSALLTLARVADVASVADLACPNRWPTTRPTPTGCAASSSTAPRWPRSRARRARWRTARARAPWRQ